MVSEKKHRLLRGKQDLKTSTYVHIIHLASGTGKQKREKLIIQNILIEYEPHSSHDDTDVCFHRHMKFLPGTSIHFSE